MKKILKLSLVIIVLLSYNFTLNAQSKQLIKQREKQYKSKMNEFKNENYKVVGTARSLDVALLEYYEKLNTNDKYQEFVVVTENCPTENLCAVKAQNDALNQYATQASANIQGRLNSELKLDASPNSIDKTSIDKFYAAYETMVKHNVSGAVKKSFAVSKKSTNGYKYQTFFLVNEEEASKARMDAAKRAVEETKLNQEWGNKIHNFIQEGFKPEGNN